MLLRLLINIVVCGRTQFAPTFIIRKIAICRGRRTPRALPLGVHDVPLIYGFFYSLNSTRMDAVIFYIFYRFVSQFQLRTSSSSRLYGVR